jgi:hypothetical protein
MLKRVKKYGSTFIITLTSEEIEFNNLKEGDFISIEIKKIGDEEPFI